MICQNRRRGEGDCPPAPRLLRPCASVPALGGVSKYPSQWVFGRISKNHTSITKEDYIKAKAPASSLKKNLIFELSNFSNAIHSSITHTVVKFHKKVWLTFMKKNFSKKMPLKCWLSIISYCLTFLKMSSYTRFKQKPFFSCISTANLTPKLFQRIGYVRG